MISTRRIGRRVTYAFVLMIVFIVSIGVCSYVAMNQVEGYLDDIVNSHAVSATTVQKVRADLYQMRYYDRDLVLNIHNKADIERYKLRWDASLRCYQKCTNSLYYTKHNGVIDGTEHAYIRDMQTIELYIFGVTSLVNKMRSGEITTVKQADEFMSPFDDKAHELLDLVEAYTTYVNAHMRVDVKLATDGVNKMQNFLLLMSGIVFSLACVIAYVIGTSNMRHNQEMKNILERASGITMESISTHCKKSDGLS